MSYEPYYSGGWQSGESGGTAVRPEALNHMDKGIKNAHILATRYGAIVNLLDNSNFAHPVNQRGGDMYVGAAACTIDRWRGTSKITIEIDSDYIIVQCSDDATQRNGFAQYFAADKIPAPGTVITVAYEDDGGNLFVGSAAVPETGSVTIGSTTGLGIRVYAADEGARVALMIPPGERVGFVWMAVYAGEYTEDNLPAYRPKDYSAELMECMRYFQIRSTGDVDPVDLRPTMRATPTITKLDDGRYAYSAEL